MGGRRGTARGRFSCVLRRGDLPEVVIVLPLLPWYLVVPTRVAGNIVKDKWRRHCMKLDGLVRGRPVWIEWLIMVVWGKKQRSNWTPQGD